MRKIYDFSKLVHWVTELTLKLDYLIFERFFDKLEVFYAVMSYKLVFRVKLVTQSAPLSHFRALMF